MQFHIPQYIDIEDKIVGPFTIKQAIYMAGGAGGAYLFFRIIPFTFISIPIIFFWVALAWALAFYPKEKLGRPFEEILGSGFRYLTKNKLYTWKKTTKEPKVGVEEEFFRTPTSSTPVIPSGKLSSASFDLDIKGPKKDEE